ncbi:hypothetical protein FORC14_4375 [Vibrio parahaemolyticus]|nr:hypothetical protein FORC14_4375 [Vibrio parahaemolyticus]
MIEFINEYLRSISIKNVPLMRLRQRYLSSIQVSKGRLN